MDDRFINLMGSSDKIAEAILCKLPGEDIIRLSFASKPLRKLCARNASSLTFQHGFDEENFIFCFGSPFDQESWNRRVACVDSFIHLCWFEDTQIKTFDLSWLYNGSPGDARLINVWLSQVVFAGAVEAINLKFLARRPQQHITTLQLGLGPVFNCPSLKKLVINLSAKGFTLPKVPSDHINMICLEYLRLEYVCCGMAELISNSCGALKELYLEHCHGLTLTINSSSLLRLHIYYTRPPDQWHDPGLNTDLHQLDIRATNLQELDITWYPIRPLNSKLVLHTPKLEVFNWTGYPTQVYICSNTPLPTKVIICVCNRLAHLQQARLNFMEFPLEDFDFIIRPVVASIGNITSLQPLCLQSVVLLARCNAFPFVFHRLTTLVLVSNRLTANEVEPLKSLLMGAPNLREFKLTSKGLHPRYNPFPEVAYPPPLAAAPANWEGVLVPQLKNLTIQLYQGQFVLDFFTFLIKNAPLLEELTVYYSPPAFPQQADMIIRSFKRDSTKFTMRVV